MPRQAGTPGNHVDPARTVYAHNEFTPRTGPGGYRTRLFNDIIGIRSNPVLRRARTLTLTFVVPQSSIPESEWKRYQPLEERTYGAAQEPVDAISVKMNRIDLVRRLQAGQDLETIFEDQRGYPRGTVGRVIELAIMPSVGG